MCYGVTIVCLYCVVHEEGGSSIALDRGGDTYSSGRYMLDPVPCVNC